MTNRFPEMWLCEGRVECGFDEGVEQLVTLFLNALRIPTPGTGERVARGRVALQRALRAAAPRTAATTEGEG